VKRFERRLGEVDPAFAEVVERVPLQDTPPSQPEWLRCEVLERYQVLQHAEIDRGRTVLEVGSGAHAIATVPLAYAIGESGRVIAAERSRWNHFRTIVSDSGMEARVRPVACDARRLPLRDNSVELAVCVHGIRSLGSEENMVTIFREMLRVAPRLFLAESLPIARNDAQRAHLAMYNLRQEIFEAATGRPDDLHYLPLDRLVRLVEHADGKIENSSVLEVDLPHSLAYLPRSYVEAIPDHGVRERLLRRWDEAYSLCRRYGTDHPPVGIVEAHRSGTP
jgi:precorrin-6B methylase 2